MSLTFHLVAVTCIKAFYANNPPHYDSVGSYTMMFRIITLMEQGAWQSAWTQAAGSFLSWLQAWFALLAAPLLNRTPDSVQALNSLALLALMGSIYAAARAGGASQIKAYLLSLMVFLPDVFYDWWGGALDMRRDFAFVALLGASLFSLLTLLWRPSRGCSLWFGLCAGLVVVSRDNALFFLLALVGGPLVVCALPRLWSRDFRWFQRFGPATAGALLLIVPWLVACLPLAMARRLDPFAMYGMGGDPWISLRHYWSMPMQLVLGHLGQLPDVPAAGWTPLTSLGGALGAPLVVPHLGLIGGGMHGSLPLALGYLALLGLLTLIAWRRGWMTLSPSMVSRAALPAGAGLWSYGATVFIICFIATLRPMGYSAAQIPFFPSLLAFFALLFALGMSLKGGPRTPRKMKQVAVAAGLSILTLLYSVLNIEAKTPEPTPQFVQIGESLTELFLAERRVVTVAFLWHEGVTLDAVAYYAARRGEFDRVRQLLYPYTGRTLDLQVGVPDGEDPAAMLAALRNRISSADFVVACVTPGAYQHGSHPFMIYTHAQPLVDELLADTRYAAVMRFKTWNDEIVVLKRGSG